MTSSLREQGDRLRERLDARSARQIAVALFVVLWVVYFATSTRDVALVNDPLSSTAAAWGLGTSGELVLPATWQDLPWRAVTVDGDLASNRFPGPTLLGAPFYALLPVEADVSRAHDVPVVPAALAASFAAAAAMALLFLVLDRLVDDRRLAVSGALVFALATPTWSVSSDALWTHAPAQFALVGAMLAASRSRWWLVGAAVGVAILSRPQLAVVAAVIGIWFAVRERSFRPAVQVGVTSALGLAAVSLYTQVLFGTWLPVAGYSRSLDRVGTIVTGTGTGEASLPFVTDVVPLLFHPLRGVLVYTLWLWVCLPGLRAGWRGAPAWVRASAVAGTVAMVTQLATNAEWHGGDDLFGYRLPLEWLTLSMPLLVLAWREVAGRHRVGRALTVATVTASVVLFALGSTVADPRHDQRPGYFRMVAELGPNGEGFDPGPAVGVDASDR